jgi:hypothetical protein
MGYRLFGELRNRNGQAATLIIATTCFDTRIDFCVKKSSFQGLALRNWDETRSRVPTFPR